MFFVDFCSSSSVTGFWGLSAKRHKSDGYPQKSIRFFFVTDYEVTVK